MHEMYLNILVKTVVTRVDKDVFGTLTGGVESLDWERTGIQVKTIYDFQLTLRYKGMGFE